MFRAEEQLFKQKVLRNLLLYCIKPLFKKVQTVFFENQVNADEFKSRKNHTT